MDFNTLKIGIWGFGKEGKSLLRHIENIGGYSELCVLTDTPAASTPDDINAISSAEALEKITSGYFDLLFTSPGISLYRPEIIQAKDNGTKFSSATNLWFEKNSKTKKIVITGTKGKSTSSSLLLHIMKASGLSVSLAGNIGTPLLDIEEETDYTILELSSYQLAGLHHAPDIFVVLNLFPEHLQWHLNHENYYQDKLKPLKFGDNFTFITNKNDTKIPPFIDQNRDVIWFNDADGFNVQSNNVYLKNKKLQIRSPLKGDHNQHNIAAVLTICNTLSMNIDDCISSIESFQTLPHRLQEFYSKDNILCVNDSISTTPETTLAAMDVYKDSPLFLIMGGTDRGQDYSAFIQALPNYNVKFIALLPKNGARLQQELEAQNCYIETFNAENLQQAVGAIKDKTTTGDTIILSPGAPSHDQFNNFEERGNLFIKLMGE